MTQKSQSELASELQGFHKSFYKSRQNEHSPFYRTNRPSFDNGSIFTTQPFQQSQKEAVQGQSVIKGQVSVDYVPPETLSYLRFVQDPKMTQLVKQFKAPSFQQSLNHKLGAKAYVRSHIREKSQPHRILLNQAGASKQKQDQDSLGIVKNQAEDLVIQSRITSDLKQQLGIRDNIIKVSDFDVNFQQVGEKLGLYMDRFNEYKAKQDYLKQTLLAQKHKKFENILTDHDFEKSEIFREVGKEYPVVMTLPKDYKQVQRQIESRTQKTVRHQSQTKERGNLKNDLTDKQSQDPDLSRIGLNSKRACSQPEEPRQIFTRGNFFQRRAPEDQQQDSVMFDFQNIVFDQKQTKLKTAGQNKRAHNFSLNQTAEQQAKHQSRSRHKNQGESFSNAPSIDKSTHSPRSNIPQLGSVNGVQIYKGETLIKMSPRTSESIAAPPTLSMISPIIYSPISSGREMEIQIIGETPRRVVVKQTSGTLLNTVAQYTELGSTQRTNFPNIEVLRNTGPRNRVIEERWAPPNQDSIVGLQNLKNSDTGQKSVVFSTSLKSVNSHGNVQSQPEAYPDGMRNIQLLKPHLEPPDFFPTQVVQPSTDLKYFYTLANKEAAHDLNSGSSKTESKISDAGEINNLISHRFNMTPEKNDNNVTAAPIQIEDNVNNSAIEFQKQFTAIQNTLLEELSQPIKQVAQYLPAKTQEFILRNYQRTPKNRSRDSQSPKQSPQQSFVMKSGGEYLITSYARPRGLSRGENSRRRGTGTGIGTGTFQSKANTVRDANEQTNEGLTSDEETKPQDETDWEKDQAPASFRGIRGKKTNPAQKFHHSLAMQTKKLKEQTKANRAAQKQTKSFLEELSVVPIVAHERLTANKSQKSQKSQLSQTKDADMEVFEPQLDLKPPLAASLTEGQTVEIQEQKEPQVTKIVMTAMRDLSDSDQNNESINRDLDEVQPENKNAIKKIPALSLSVVAKNKRNNSPLKQPVPVNLVNLVLDVNNTPDLKPSNIQQLLMRKHQIMREQHLKYQITQRERQFASDGEATKPSKAPFIKTQQVTMGQQTSSRFFEPIPSDRLGEVALDMSPEQTYREILDLQLDRGVGRFIMPESFSHLFTKYYSPINSKLHSTKTNIEVKFQMQESKNVLTAERLGTHENSKIYLSAEQGLDKNENLQLSNFSLNNLKDQVRITKNPSLQHGQINQRFTRTNKDNPNESLKMTMTSVASADQKQANKQSSLFMNNAMKSQSHIPNMVGKKILKPNPGVNSLDETVKIFKTTRKSVFEQLNAAKDIKDSNLDLLKVTPISKMPGESTKNEHKSSVDIDSGNDDLNRSFLYGTYMSRKYSKINSELATDNPRISSIAKAKRISTLHSESINQTPQMDIIPVAEIVSPANASLDTDDSVEDATSQSQPAEIKISSLMSAEQDDETMIHLILPEQQPKLSVITNPWQQEQPKKPAKAQKSSYMMKIEQDQRSPLLKSPNYVTSKKHRKMKFGAEDVWALKKMEQQRTQNRNI